MTDDEYLAGVRRMLNALGNRVGEGDLETLRKLVALRTDLESAITESVRRLRTDDDLPASWQAIADAMGMSRSAVRDRYRHVGGVRRRGGQPAGWR